VTKIVTKLIAELVGTASLVAVVVGSGIMGTSLSADSGVALIINAFSTIFALGLLILVIGPISGAHFNPVVSLTQWLGKELSGGQALGYFVAQVFGAIFGAILANLMFNLSAISIATHQRTSTGTLIGEAVATAGLIVVIGVLSRRGQSNYIPVAVPAWIGSAYFFTSSTSFANPAVTVGRIFSNTFAGIAPDSVAPFILAQLVGALLGFALVKGIKNVSN
jgi:glycerol uptake facilitator-like aquaporin